MTEVAWWYATRASGILAALLLGTSVVAGALLAARAVRGRGVPRWLLDLHRGAAGLASVAVGVHLVALWADSFARLGLADLLVPLHSDYDPRGVLLGVVALWLLVVVEGTSLALRSLPRRWWRRVHLLSWVLAVLVVLHGWDAGTDAGHPALTAVAGATVAAVAVAGVLRLRAVLERRAPAVDDRLTEVLDAPVAAAQGERSLSEPPAG